MLWATLSEFILSPGQDSDITQAEASVASLPADHVLGDKGYDAKACRDVSTEQGAVAVIPPRALSAQVEIARRFQADENAREISAGAGSFETNML